MADNVNIIVQDTINDIVVNAAVIVETIDINVQAAVDEVQIIANPNNYVVNINRIIGEQVQSDWDQADDQAPDYIKNKPSIPTLTSDLTNDGEDGINPFITAADVTAQVNSDWNAISGVAEILNKPTIPAAQVNSDWNATTGVAQILNKPTIPANGLPAGGTAGQILTKVDATDYNATWQENFADWTSQVKHTVKNNGLSGTITKGTAVYVTGSNGTNMLVGRASNASEATSSKTMGLMESNITTTGGTQTGFVVTEGLLQGLNTAGQTAGDPVWLGVNGALIYGLTNKPYAPAHLVFIGIVTKVSAGNGEIFVKVQNGFELKEIHDVDLITTTPINGHLLGFDGTLWVNKTIASWLGFTPVTDARTISTTAPLSGGGDLSANRTLSITQATTSTNGYLSSTDWNTFNGKQEALVSGTNIKTINGNTLLGSGDLVISSSNIYTANGSLSAARTLTLNGFPLTFAGTTSTRFFANGNIGINQLTDAGYKLDVNGTAKISGNTTIIAATPVLNVNVTANTQTSALYFNALDGTPRAGILANIATGEIRYLATATGYFPTFYSNNSERMRIFTTGNVAINTTTDAGFKLDVNGTARFNNSVIAQTVSSVNVLDIGSVRIADDGNGRYIQGVNGIALRATGTPTTNILTVASGTGNTWKSTQTISLNPNSGFGGVLFSSTNIAGPSNTILTFVRQRNDAAKSAIINTEDFASSGNTAVNIFIYAGKETVLNNQANLILSHDGTNARGNTLIGTSTNVASAIVNVESTTQGFLPPRMTTTQKNAIATPAAGLMVYDTTLNLMALYNGTIWTTL